MSEHFASAPARAEDIPVMLAFIFEHGPNPWNYLPQDAVLAHLQGIAEGSVRAVLARRESGALVGFVTFLASSNFERYQAPERRDLPQGYVGEAVVHRELAGRGLGSRLLGEAVQGLQALGIDDIYIERHEENAGSAGMMRKAGFVEVETFADPQRRAAGSRRTTLCYLRASS
ncbi:GNAT family N-acetyltransferase [Pseudomonas sp. ML96]|uniref:GNAT family N-acetyltransferase n=1 Tax=Pseudomonas sp. ML96 TaxID=1523503 RepID=UPI00068C5F9A|nr:GNAT family N-acetyltransferase [Pseudomonas sp. ML96]